MTTVRGARRAISGLLLGAAVMALDSQATPDLFDAVPWSPRAPWSEEAPDGVPPLETSPIGIDRGPGPLLDLGEIRFYTGVLTPAPGDLHEDDASLLFKATGLNPSEARPLLSTEHAITAPEPMLRETTWQEPAPEATRGRDAGGAVPARSSRTRIPVWDLRQIAAEVRDTVTHPLTILVVLILLVAWLTAQMMAHVDRLRATQPRSPGRRHRGHR